MGEEAAGPTAADLCGTRPSGVSYGELTLESMVGCMPDPGGGVVIATSELRECFRLVANKITIFGPDENHWRTCRLLVSGGGPHRSCLSPWPVGALLQLCSHRHGVYRGACKNTIQALFFGVSLLKVSS